VDLSHSEGCDMAKSSLCPIFKHFEPISVKMWVKIAWKAKDLFVKTLKIFTMGQKLKFSFKDFFKYTFFEPSRGPLLNRNYFLGGVFQKIFFRKSEPRRFWNNRLFTKTASHLPEMKFAVYNINTLFIFILIFVGNLWDNFY
jgi:hypothetical protein